MKMTIILALVGIGAALLWTYAQEKQEKRREVGSAENNDLT
jgi:hypothetical protein